MRNAVTIAGAVLLLAGAVVSAADETPPNPNRHPDAYFTLGHEPATPCIAWARPFAGPRLKVLVIGPRWGQRETIELQQRFDAEITPVLTYAAGQVGCAGGGWSHQQDLLIKRDVVLRELTAKLRAGPQVIVLGKGVAPDLPPELLTELRALVRRGTGLVWLWPDHLPLEVELKGTATAPAPAAPDALALEDPQAAVWRRLWPVAGGIPFEALPGFAVRQRATDVPAFLTLGEYGQGRVVYLAYRGGGELLTPTDKTDLHYEYYQAFLIKTLLWAGRAEPAISIAAIPSLLTDARELACELANASPRAAEITVSLAVRSADPLARLPAAPRAAPGVHETATVLAPLFTRTEEQALPPGRSSRRLALPALPAGDYFADLQVAVVAGQVAWATVALKVIAPVTLKQLVCTPDVLDLALPALPPVQVRVTLSAPLPQPTRLDLALLDAHDRVLATATRDLPAAADTADATLVVPAPSVASTLLRVRAELAGLARQTASLTAVNRPWDDFTLFCWGGNGPSYLARQRFRMEAALGVDAVRGGASLESFQVADIRHVWDLGRWNGQVDKATHSLAPCFASEEFRAPLRQQIERSAESAARFDGFGVMFGDEFQFCGGGLGGACRCAACAARLGPFLGQPAADPAQVPPVDQWRFNQATFADTVGYAAAYLAPRRATLRLGPSTPLWNWYYRCYDWEAIMAHCTYATPYGPWSDRAHFEAIRSFARPGTILSIHFGSYVGPDMHDEAYQRLKPYVALFRGCRNVFWYTAWGDEGGLAPSLAPFPCLAQASAAVREIKAGVGPLLLGATRQPARVAIHYSRASFFYSFLVSGPHVAWRYNDLIAALSESGYAFDFVSTRQILAGALASYGALVLPVSQCIGDAEAARLREFAAGGGVLIADYRPGVADEHGALGRQTLVPHLFGLAPSGPAPLPQYETLAAATTGAYRGHAFAGPADEQFGVDPALRLAGATAGLRAGDVPVVTARTEGQGAAVCLNANLSGPFARNLLGVVLAAHGLAPQATMLTPAAGWQPGAWLPGLEVHRFTDGAAEYVALARNRVEGAAPGRVRVTFARAGRMYDVLTGRDLGAGATQELALPSASLTLLACLPYRVTAVDASAAPARVGGTLTGSVRVVTDGAPAGRHVVHLAATRPDGQVVRYLARNLTAPAGAAAFALPLALNEPPGQWTLTLTEVTTHTQTALTVRVE